jgi:sulfoacetaldehyde dehydrogenase
MAENKEEETKAAAELVQGYMARAKKAFQTAEAYSQEKLDELATGVGWAFVKNADEIGHMIHEESSLGRLEHKILKTNKKVRGMLRDIQNVRTRGVVDINPKNGITQIAKSVGVIGAITPVTNGEASPEGNIIFSIKAGNAIVMSPHPRGKKSAYHICELARQELKKQGAPEDLVQCIPNPTIPISTEVMRQCDLVHATGGTAMVKTAHSVGKPAYGVGVGNPAIVVDETADIKDAAHKIMLGKTFDWGSSCSSECSIIAEESIYDKLLKALQAEGGYLLNKEQKQALQKVFWTKPRAINRDIVCQPVQKIGEVAGITVPKDKIFIIVEEEGIGIDYPFSGEKLSPILAVYKYKGLENAIKLVNEIHATPATGAGHCCGIHSFNEDHIMEYALKTKESRVIVRQPQAYANSGDWVNGMPFTLSEGTGTWGENITSENIHLKHYINITWVSRPIAPVIPTDESLFGAYWAKYGK